MSANDTKNKIIDCAAKLFSEKGYEGVRTKEIASLSGISEVTLFKYFPKKEILYREIFRIKFTPPDLSFAIEKLKYENFEDDLSMIAKNLMLDFYKNKNLMKMRHKEIEHFMKDRKFCNFENPLLKTLLPVFEKHTEKGLIKGEAKRNAEVFLVSVKGIFHEAAITNMSKEVFASLVTDYIKIYCKGVENNDR